MTTPPTTTNPPILRNSWLALPLAIVAGFCVDQPTGIAAAVSGLLVLGNLWVYSVLGPRLVAAVAREEGLGLWAAALLAKFVLVVGALWGLLHFAPPVGVALGFLPLFLGTLGTGIQLALSDPGVDPSPTPTNE